MPAESGALKRNQPDGEGARRGMSDAGLAGVVAQFTSMVGEDRHPGAQLSVYRDGALVLELAAGHAGDGRPVEHDSLMNILSTTKALTALVMHLLHDRGVYGYDDLVAAYWPDFAHNGKEQVTIRQVLSHRSGVTSPVVAYQNWQLWSQPGWVARTIEDMDPAWTPGTANGYHATTYGWICDELCKRWTGHDVGRLLRSEFCAPLGVDDAWIGLPAEQFHRFAPFQPNIRPGVGEYVLPDDANGFFFNSFQVLRQCLPWGSGVTTSRALGRLLSVFAMRGSLDGHTFFGEQTLRELMRPTNGEDDVDRGIGRKIRWGLGLWVNGTEGVRGVPGHILGADAGPLSGGHMGGNMVLGWADAQSRLAMAFISTRAPAAGQYEALSNAVRGACKE